MTRETEMLQLFEDLIKGERNNRIKADKFVQPWQRELKYGDCVIRKVNERSEIVIIGELIDPVETERKCYDDPENDPENDEEFIEMKKYYVSEEYLNSYRFGKFYSIFCPRGELGDVHISTITQKITREEFLETKEKISEELV